VVIAIIGLLSSIVIASISDVRSKSRDARRVADLIQIKNAAALYRSDNNENMPSLGNTGWNCLGLNSNERCWEDARYPILGNNLLQSALSPYIKSSADPGSRRGHGDYYLYKQGAVPLGCWSDPSPQVGVFILWIPESKPTGNSSNPTVARDRCAGDSFLTCLPAGLGFGCALSI
jgi:type II secretory pathway pseudopilin PulG